MPHSFLAKIALRSFYRTDLHEGLIVALFPKISLGPVHHPRTILTRKKGIFSRNARIAFRVSKTGKYGEKGINPHSTAF